MNIKYLTDTYGREKAWNDITREERYFCAELFFELRANKVLFLELIGRSGKVFDIGYEACFYRDFMKNNGLSAKKEGYKAKRTFDLVLLSEEEIIIIEAKAYQGFDNKQLSNFDKDKVLIPKMFKEVGIKNCPGISIIGIHSSKYHPSADSEQHFDQLITWKDVAGRYASKKDIFNRADDVYKL
jgi:hypothetical protein